MLGLLLRLSAAQIADSIEVSELKTRPELGAASVKRAMLRKRVSRESGLASLVVGVLSSVDSHFFPIRLPP